MNTSAQAMQSVTALVAGGLIDLVAAFKALQSERDAMSRERAAMSLELEIAVGELEELEKSAATNTGPITIDVARRDAASRIQHLKLTGASGVAELGIVARDAADNIRKIRLRTAAGKLWDIKVSGDGVGGFRRLELAPSKQKTWHGT